MVCRCHHIIIYEILKDLVSMYGLEHHRPIIRKTIGYRSPETRQQQTYNTSYIERIYFDCIPSLPFWYIFRFPPPLWTK